MATPRTVVKVYFKNKENNKGHLFHILEEVRVYVWNISL